METEPVISFLSPYMELREQRAPSALAPPLSVISQRCDVVDSEVRTERFSIRAVSKFCFDLV